MIIYQIKLPKKQDVEAFARFMRDEYLPAVHKEATRMGQVNDLRLLRGSTETGEAMHEFFLHVGWSGLPGGNVRIDDEGIDGKFNAFGARLKRVGFYNEVASWHVGKA